MALKPSADLTVPSKLIFELIQILKTSSSPDLRTWASSVLDHLCRQLECFVTPEVSDNAAEEASAQGLADLSSFVWSDQVGKMRDMGREVFHWEHVLPVAELKRRLLHELTTSVEHVQRIIAGVDVAWILKSEDASLTKKGYTHRRPGDPWKAYTDAEIKIRGRGERGDS